ncbi:hypothetical protein PF005_g11832 [Phytophthora fragariae]|uniref:Uncharacterized protein n=1 Tax=Phytophthora fragariae TaxID=53985 RepID=A0A6A3KIJ1_9STRA|nr:hypothetical protein PF003_g24346 [Phytophthora fragariae]KAE8937064.1 hypothetical protein PF009_g13021 [Phytophthora fragariae]KAE9005627.1 hypothetical protein PF011_g11959 [Phytophthora fragariae]KAE9105832.1 hypothetical protein PF010_g12851 [Phytophthora fragariae]KAE9107031.1 hypothetical protein PF007_g13186 [Phytophthora fragariae]
MASPQLLDAAIPRDGVVREAPYTLLCMVVAVEKAAADVNSDVWSIYQVERGVEPFERVLEAAGDFSLQRAATTLKHKRDQKAKQQEEEEEEASVVPQASSLYVQADLTRLLSSSSRAETRKILERQLERLRLSRIRELTGVSLPTHLQITPLEEDPLEFRRDTQGVAQVWGRNVLGERYAPKADPLRYLHTYSVPELFQRMKRAVRNDLSTRNQRRIAALNAKERERKTELERQGILTPEQQLEAKFDRLLNASA